MRNGKIATIIAALVLLAACGLWFWIGRDGTGLLVVTALDVGQGDAILIRTPNGNDILIDGGPSAAVLERLARHLPPSDRTIELVIVTHTDADHVNGLADVATHYRIGRVLDNGTSTTNPAYRRWTDILERQHTSRSIVTSGDRFEIDGVLLEVIWPDPTVDLSRSSRNDTSVVVRMVYGSTSFLFTGDISSDIESRLLLQHYIQSTNVLKVAHHGSAYSSDTAFLDAVASQYALISAGKGNSYGHPHRVVVQRLRERNIEVLRTDESGDIIVESDGRELTIDH